MPGGMMLGDPGLVANAVDVDPDGECYVCRNARELDCVCYAFTLYAPITMNLATPGAVASNLARHTTLEDAIKLGWVREDGSLAVGEMRSPEVGAASPVWAAVTPELEGRGGVYIEDLVVAPIFDSPREDCWGVTAESLDPELAGALWNQLLPHIAPFEDLADNAPSEVKL